MKNIVLVGMRGSGKSTLGKLFAERSGLEFVDTDSEIEKKAGKSISEIVAEHGWEYFRELETQVCREVSELQDAVISTGGGVILKEENVELLRKNGKIVLLHVPTDELIRRLENSPNTRPALKDGLSLGEEMERVWEERKERFFAVADVVCEEVGDVEGCVERLERQIKNEIG